MTESLSIWLTALTLMVTGAPPIPHEYLDKGWVRGDECGSYTNVVWHELRRQGIGPLTDHPNTGDTWLRTLCRVSGCESNHDPSTRYVNRGGSKPGSVDRGFWQFNSEYFGWMTDAMAHDVVASTRVAVRLFKKGLHGRWVCFRLLYV